MTIELITGKALSPHVDSADDGAYHARTMGAGTYVLHGCACTMADANTAHIAPGELLVEGRHVRIMGTGEDVTVENGTQGQKRHDLLVVRYELGEEDVETAVLAVVKGVPTSTGEPNDPSCATGSILAGDPLAEHPLYRVPLDGVSVGTPVPLCEPWEPLAVACERIGERLLEVVPGKRGGTGGDSLFRGMSNLVNSVSENSAAPSDASRFLMPTSDRSVVWRSAANVWTWIASKVRSTFGFGSTNVLGVSNGGTGATTAAAARSNLAITPANIGAAATSHTHTAASIGAAAASHTHAATNITSGVLPVKYGGTGTTSNAGIGLLAYPVGAVYISFVSTSPGSLFGGTWTELKGVFPYFNGSTAKGGSNTHTLSIREIPAHNHSGGISAKSVGLSASGGMYGVYSPSGTGMSGDGAAHNNMPAYQTLYAWRRTA